MGQKPVTVYYGSPVDRPKLSVDITYQLVNLLLHLLIMLRPKPRRDYREEQDNSAMPLGKLSEKCRECLETVPDSFRIIKAVQREDRLEIDQSRPKSLGLLLHLDALDCFPDSLIIHAHRKRVDSHSSLTIDN